MRTLGFTDYDVDVLAPEEYLRQIARLSTVTVRVGWLKWRIIVNKTWIAARIATQLLRTVWNTTRLEKMLSCGADDVDRLAHHELVRSLDSRRELYKKVADLHSCVLSVDDGEQSALVPTILRLLDEFLLVVDDMVETLELCVDPEVREQIGNEIQRIADSGSPDIHVRTSA